MFGGTTGYFKTSDIETFVVQLPIESSILTASLESTLRSLIGFELVSFSLLYRATRDTFAGSAFHNKCDGKPNTLVVVRSETGYILGGFASVAWSSVNTDIGDPSFTSFLFTLTNPSNTPMKIPLIKSARAINNNVAYGPIFGEGWDLMVYESSSATSTACSTSLLAYKGANGLTGVNGGIFMIGGTNGNFVANEVEVFLVN
jgi:hypothetical protein